MHTQRKLEILYGKCNSCIYLYSLPDCKYYRYPDAAKYDILKIVIRIAPLCCDKLLLVRREDNKWDLPVIRTYNGALRKADSFAEQLVEDFLHYKKESP